jgi:hypothetical protein
MPKKWYVFAPFMVQPMDLWFSKGVTGRRRDFPNVSPQDFCGENCGPLPHRYHKLAVFEKVVCFGFDYRTNRATRIPIIARVVF